MCWYLSAERLYCSQKFDYISMDLIKILFNLHQSTSSTHVVWTFGFVVQPGTRQTCDKVIKTKLSCNQPWVKIRNINDKFIINTYKLDAIQEMEIYYYWINFKVHSINLMIEWSFKESATILELPLNLIFGWELFMNLVSEWRGLRNTSGEKKVFWKFISPYRTCVIFLHSNAIFVVKGTPSLRHVR